MLIKTKDKYTLVGACVLRKDNIAAILRKNIESEDLDFFILYFDGNMFFELPLGNDYYMGIVNRGDDVFVLGKTGNITRYTLHPKSTINNILNSRKDWLIEESADYGDLIRIRLLGKNILCCGQFSQLYIFDSDSWKAYDHGLRNYDSPDLQDIGGTDREEIYGVGLDGVVNKFDGRHWIKLDVPTNQHILCVERYSSDEFFMAGYNGLIIKGKDGFWELKGEYHDDKRYWDCASYDGLMYFVHSKGVDRLVENTIERVDMHIPGEDLSFHRLFSGQDYLWSIGEQHVLFFNGYKWDEFTMTV